MKNSVRGYAILRLLFAFGASLALSVPAQEATNIYWVVNKTQTFYQSNSSPPVLDCELPFCFFTSARSDELFVSLTKVVVKTPLDRLITNEATTLVIGTNEYPNVRRFFDCEMARQEIDEEYLSGNYEATFDFLFLGLLPDTARVEIPFAGDLYPNTPRFLNAESAQQIVADRDFSIRWEPFADGGDLDAVALRVFECSNSVSRCTNCAGRLVFQAEVPATNQSPSVILPAGTLRPGASYEAQLVFDHWNAYRTSNYAVAGFFDVEIVARSSYAKVTRLPLQLSTAPKLQVLSSPGAIPFRFRFNSMPGHIYQIQASADLRQWVTVQTTNAFSTMVLFEEMGSAPDSRRFFQVVAP